MKFSFAVLLTFFSFNIMAATQKVRLDSGITLKFNDEKWTYQYIQALSSITPHIFESKTNKALKVIVQKETHIEAVKDRKALVAEKCNYANKFYQEAGQGTAKNLKIKNANVCLIELIKDGQRNFQVIYPVKFTKKSYNVISFAWKGEERTLDEVRDLVGGSL